MIRAIVFDLFDTLVDLDCDALPEVEVLGERRRSTYRVLYDALSAYSSVDFDTFARALRDVDRRLWATRAKAGLEFSTDARFGALLGSLRITRSEAAEKLTKAHMAAFRSLVRRVSHHEAVLRRLKHHARLAVCSNFSHAPTARAILQEAKLLQHLDAVVVSADLGIRKPRPEIFEVTLDRLGSDAGETLHVGNDLAVDVEGASRAGMPAVWIIRRVREPELELRSYRGPRPCRVIRDIAELELMLDRRPAEAAAC